MTSLHRTTETVAVPTVGSPGHARQRRRVVTASLVGTVIEYYDFLIYSIAASLFIGPLFFANASSQMATVLSFATLAVGYVARPIGSIVFGHFGDRVGRKSTLIVTLLLMGSATVLMGMLPTHSQIGAWAPILLIGLRLVQGFAVGGEYGGAALMAVEHAQPNKRGLFGSVPVVGSAGGMLLAFGVFYLVGAVLTDEQMMAWGWRVPFLLSALLIVFAVYMRMSIAESPVLVAAQAEAAAKPSARLPIVELLVNYWRPVLIGVVIGVGYLFGSSIATVYALSYATSVVGIPVSTMLLATQIAMAGLLLSHPFYGAVSDRYGRKPVFVVSMLLLAPSMFFFFAMVRTGSTGLVILAFVVVLTLLLGAPGGVAGAMMAELFPTTVRYTGVSLVFQLASLIGLGFGPLIATSLVNAADGSTVLLASVFGIVCVVSAIAVSGIKEGRKVDLHTVS